MAFDANPAGDGGNHHGRWCTSCRQPILDGQRSVDIRFNHDPHGHRGLTGPYHEGCSRPFRSFAHVLNMDWFGKW
jgi:hypothetical protein